MKTIVIHRVTSSKFGNRMKYTKEKTGPYHTGFSHFLCHCITDFFLSVDSDKNRRRKMEFTYSREQEMVKKMLKEFAENEIAPISAEIDEKAEYPYETIAKLGELGLMGMPFPQSYGGAGTDYLTYIMAIEEISKVDAAHGVIIQTHNALCCWPIFTYGTEEQKQQYLPDLLSGKKLGAFGLTEPNAGTDAAGTQTKAVLDGEEWILNGSKIFISGGGIADVYIIMAMTDQSKGTKGISAFIVEKGTPGFTAPKHENKMGIRGSIAAELVFEDCRIPKENLLGQEGKGFKVAMSSLDVGRLGIAAQALGIAQGAFDQPKGPFFRLLRAVFRHKSR